MNKEQTRLARLRDLYKSPDATEQELYEIAYNRGVNLDYYRKLGVIIFLQ